MTATRRFLAGVLALSLPLAAIAQTAPAAPAPAAAPAAEGIKLTPYGFILANGFFNGNSLQTRDYGGPGHAAPQGGSVLFSARQSRIGLRLAAKEDWSGADLTGVLEFDFAGGNLSGLTPNAAAPSTAWYNGLMRLRLAAMTAAWKTELRQRLGARRPGVRPRQSPLRREPRLGGPAALLAVRQPVAPLAAVPGRLGQHLR